MNVINRFPVIKLFVFAASMLLLSSICNGQGVKTFGATLGNDTSLSGGQLRLSAYGGSVDTMLLTVLSNGRVIKVSKTAFTNSYTAGWALALSGNQFTVDSNVLHNVFLKIYDPFANQFVGNVTAGNIHTQTLTAANLSQFNDGVYMTSLDPQEDRIITGANDGAIGKSVYSTTDILDSIGSKATIDTLLQFLPVYNIEHYGAIANDGDEDGWAIEDAILAATGYEHVGFNAARGIDTIRKVNSVSGGIVFTPAHGIYNIDKPLIDTVVHLMPGGVTVIKAVNAQIYLPYTYGNDERDSINPLNIIFLGEVQPSPGLTSTTLTSNRDGWTNGGNWKSGINTDGSSFPFVLSSVEGDFNLGCCRTNPIFPILKNMWITAHYDSTSGGTQIGGVNFKWAYNAIVEDSRIDVDMDADRYSDMSLTNDFAHTTVGYWGTETGQGTSIAMTRGLITGYRVGASVGEQMHLNRPNIFVNYIGIDQQAAFHPTVYNFPVVQWATIHLQYNYLPHFFNDPAYITGGMTIEKYCPVFQYDIKDTANKLRTNPDGFKYITRESGSGCAPPGGIIANLGADSLNTSRIDSWDWRAKTMTKATTETGIQVMGVDTNSGGKVVAVRVIRVNNGKVGIGTAAPGSLLDIQGTDGNAGILARRFSADANAAFFIGYGADASSHTLADKGLALFGGRGYTDAAAEVSSTKGSIGIFASENWTNAGQGTYIKFSTTATGGTTNTEHMRLIGGGQFGIGTVAPAVKLDVVGTDANAAIFARRFSTDANAPLFAGYGSTADSTTLSGKGLVLLSARGYTNLKASVDATKGSVGIFADENWTSSANGTRITFNTTANGSTTLTERLRVKSTGVINIASIQEFADNAAALAGGLVAGDLYRTGDAVKIVH